MWTKETKRGVREGGKEPRREGTKKEGANRIQREMVKMAGFFLKEQETRGREAHEREKFRVGGGVKSQEALGCQHRLWDRCLPC